MIETPTTFVVGAGSSCEYSLPSAGKLAEDARLLPTTDADGFRRVARAANLGQEDARNAVSDLTFHGAESIDEWLDHRRDDPGLQRFGKCLIAYLLHKRIEETRDNRGQWLTYVLNRIREGATTLAAFQQQLQIVRFITFNFDSCIERHVQDCAERTYRYQAAGLTFNPPRVLHVHGRLPDAIDLGSPTSIAAAADKIRIVHDDVEGSQDLDEARLLLNETTVLCFLGFSYHKTNLDRLRISYIAQRRPDNELRIFGSMFNVEQSKRQLTVDRLRRNNFAEQHFGHQSDQCLDFLKKHYVLRE